MSQKINKTRNNPRFALVSIAFLTGIIVHTGDLGAIDTIMRLQETHSYWTDVPPVDPSYYPDIGIIGKNGTIHNIYGMGQSLVMLPADIIATLLIETLNISGSIAEKLRYAIVGYLTFPLISTLGVLMGCKFLKLLKFTEKEAIAGSLGLLFGSTFLHYTQVNQENSLLFLMTLSGYYFNVNWLITNNKKYLLVGAFALGFNLLIRLTTIWDILAVSMFVLSILLLQTKGRHWDLRLLKKRIMDYSLICIPIYSLFIMIDRVYHWIRFGTFTGTYLHIWAAEIMTANPQLPENFPFSTPLMTGLMGFMFSPYKSIFLFDPLIIITLTLFVKYWRKIPDLLRLLCLSLLVLLVLYIIFYATYDFWQGGSCWGARFLTIPVQLLALIAIPLMLKLHSLIKSKIERLGYGILIITSLLIQLSSVIFGYQLEENQIDASNNQPTMVIGLRLLNILAVVLNKFDSWGLSYYGHTERLTTLNFMPFLASKYLSPQASYLIQLIWLLGLISLIILIFRFTFNIWRQDWKISN